MPCDTLAVAYACRLVARLGPAKPGLEPLNTLKCAQGWDGTERWGRGPGLVGPGTSPRSPASGFRVDSVEGQRERNLRMLGRAQGGCFRPGCAILVLCETDVDEHYSQRAKLSRGPT